MAKDIWMSGAYTHEITIPKRMYEVDKDWGIIHGDERFIECIMKVVCGYHLGSTMEHYMKELGLAQETHDERDKLIPTRKAKEFLYFYYHSKQARFIFEGKEDE